MAHSVASPEAADRLIAQGNALEDNGDFAAALSCYRTALTLAPDYARAHMNVGNALQRLGRLDEAIAAQREAVVRAPGYAPAHFNLASLLVASGDFGAAESKLRDVLRLQPDMVEAAVVLAEVLDTTGRSGDAEAELKRALRIRPDFAGAALNLGLLYLQNNRIDDAESMLLRARTLGDASAPIEAALGTLYLRTGRVTDARRAFRHALDIDPALQRAQSPLLFGLSLSAELDPATIFREHARVGDIMVLSGHRFTTWTNHPDPERRIKIGYVSGDFRQHPVGLFLRPVLEGHDRARHEVHCYSNHRTVDSVTRLLQQSVEHWHSIAAETDAGVADRIRQDQIDILVDLSGHTDNHRMAVFATHPAPIQVAWLGYLDTTGLATMDYRICDWHTDPEGATEHLHTERLVRTPHSQWCYAPIYDVPPAAPMQGKRTNAVVFGAFNQYMKLSDYCLELWCRILGQLPEARLLALGVPSGNTQDAFRRRLAQRNVAPERVEVRDRLGILEYFAAIASVDIALETFPYNGATTALDTLWMGVPLVALPGERSVARGSYSILRSMQLPELIASGPDDYVNLNVRLARDQSWRNELRTTLRDRLAKSPLMDRATFVADLESAYRQMWRAWCDSQGSLRLAQHT